MFRGQIVSIDLSAGRFSQVRNAYNPILKDVKRAYFIANSLIFQSKSYRAVPRMTEVMGFAPALPSWFAPKLASATGLKKIHDIKRAQRSPVSPFFAAAESKCYFG